MYPSAREIELQELPIPARLSANIQPYLLRLYVESRQILFRILLGEGLPPQEPFPSDPAQTMEVLRRIESLIANDSHLDGCREKLGEQFPGRLAVMFNLASEEDKLFPNDLLRQSIQNHVQHHQADLGGQRPDCLDIKAIEELKKSSKLQEQLAYLVNYTPNKWLLEQEIPVILESRRRRTHATESEPAVEPSKTAPLTVPVGGVATPSTMPPIGRDSYSWSRDTGRLSGLCFSGGGIRSATFNLGVLQGLASKRLLHRFDYCSSVSGGGYIHQWFAAWVKREESLHKTPAGSPGLDAVCRQLIPLPEPGCGPLSPEPIRWLRRYSNYLTPKTGMFSADSWVTFAIWIRNTFLNQIILISFLLSILLLPHLFLLPNPVPNLTKIDSAPAAGFGFHLTRGIVEAAVLIILVLSSYALLVRNLAAGLSDAWKGDTCDSRLNDKSLTWAVMLPALVVSIATSDFGFYFNVPGLNKVYQAGTLCLLSFLALFVLSIAVTIAGGAMDKRHGMLRDVPALRVIGFTLAAIVAALAGSGAILVTRNTFVTGNPFNFDLPHAGIRVPIATGDGKQNSLNPPAAKVTAASAASAPTIPKEAELKWRLVVVFGPLIVMALPFLTIILQCGLVGYDFPDRALEWLGRVRAWVTMYSLVWTVLVGIAIFGHQLVDWLFRTGAGGWIKWPAIGSWLLTTAGSVLAGKSSASNGEAGGAGDSRWMNILIAVGPPVYILGLLFLLAWVAQEVLWMAGISSDNLSAGQMCLALCGVLVLPIGIFLSFGKRVDINEFSMHSYYRNRLARCYLGASNTERDPDLLTGFDTADVDGLHLSAFVPSQGYTGPFPIFCASLNISIGEDLAWQERKAASFAFTPLFTGYHVPWTGKRYSGKLSFNGFVPTERFAYPNGGINISTVAAVSGAAISPNWGYHTSPPMAFLLTMFNVRLGWWLPNPRRSYLAFDPAGEPPPYEQFPRPKFAPNQLLRELFGQIGDDSKFVYLTDGGHFDNMGLYELVRRRCYEIVICDAEEDTGPVFEGIGMAIRKCRIDFGVEIELDLNKLATDAVTRVSKVHWITGTIKYPETGNAKPGSILYIKSSIVGNEAADVYNYRLQHAPFPQDSTLDQWFTESQFESYRRLGQQVIDRCPYFARS